MITCRPIVHEDQFSATLPNMINEITKSTHVEGEQSDLSQNPRLAAGSTQGAIEQNEHSSGDEVQEITNEGEREPPLKKANMNFSGDFSDCRVQGRWAASEEHSNLLDVIHE